MQRHNKILKLGLIAILLLSFVLQSEAKIRLPNLVSDGMVLQRDSPLQLWGWATPNERIIVKFLDKVYQTKTDKKGDWKISLPSQKAGGPYVIQVNDIQVKDVLIGDVWLCSGQSNMELPISRTLDLYADEVKDANNPNIRLFRAPIHYNFNNEEPDYQGGEWKAVTPSNILDFSAVAYFFAKDLYEKYNIPIGLVSTAVGGSPAEAWISGETLKKYPAYEAEAKKCAAKGYIDEVRKQEQELSREWYINMVQSDKGIGQWYKTDIDLSEWQNFSFPGLWKDKDLKINNGVVWFRKDFDISQEDNGKAAILRMGYIIDSDSTFVNGTFVGTTGYQYPPRVYNIPEGVLKVGKNTVTVRVVTNASGGFMEDKLYKIILKDKSIDLTGDWKFRIGAELPPGAPMTFFQYKPMGLYNGMIAPLANYKIKGIIWYQGESNTNRAKEYVALFQDMINDWRKQRNESELPFIYAQLPELNKPSRYLSESGLAELREAQRQALDLPQTGMAVTLGFGEWNDIHPQNKKDVALLMSLQAQKIAYGNTEIVSSGPQLQKTKIEGNSIILTFTSVGSGLYTNQILNGFTIAGTDKKFVWANAVVLNKNTVKVWSNQVKDPVVIRYAWADNPEGANLKNKEGLVASPFTTE